MIFYDLPFLNEANKNVIQFNIEVNLNRLKEINLYKRFKHFVKSTVKSCYTCY